jgi:hypothetical protein
MASDILVGRGRRRVRRDTHGNESRGVERAIADGAGCVERHHDARGLAESAEDAESAEAENDVPRDESAPTPQSLAPSTSAVGSSVRSSVWTRIRPFVAAKCLVRYELAQPRTASGDNCVRRRCAATPSTAPEPTPLSSFMRHECAGRTTSLPSPASRNNEDIGADVFFVRSSPGESAGAMGRQPPTATRPASTPLAEAPSTPGVLFMATPVVLTSVVCRSTSAVITPT